MELTKIGRYEIKSELGRGGMATVYRAYDPSFDREVAVKVLPREFLHNPQFHDRFQREIKTIAKLEHPAIVPVYDVGMENDLPFFVMRYMAGGSLSDRIKKGKIPLQATALIIARIAQALAYAHRKGFVHRDLKPDNILFDENGDPFISDFGIVKLSEEATGALTGSGIIGTPAYMSPEQATGDKLDSRSDIYGLGVIVFQMLSGKQPYNADTPMGVAIKHVTDPVPEIRAISPDAPEEAENIIKTAMAKDRDQRYPTAIDLARALHLVAFGTEGEIPSMPISGNFAPVNLTEEPAKPPMKLLPIIIAGVVVFVLAAAGIIWFLNGSSTPPPTATVQLPTAPPTLVQATKPVFAPLCKAPNIPRPEVQETNKVCTNKLPYTTLEISKGATFESQLAGFTCEFIGENDGKDLILCTGQENYSFNLKVCTPPILPPLQLSTNSCAPNDGYDAANKCCMVPLVPDAGCEIFQVDLRGCS